MTRPVPEPTSHEALCEACGFWYPHGQWHFNIERLHDGAGRSRGQIRTAECPGCGSLFDAVKVQMREAIR